MHTWLDNATRSPWFLAVFLPFFGGILSRSVCFGIASIPLRRLADDAHWTEKARKLWPARTASTSCMGGIITIAYLWTKGVHHLPTSHAVMAVLSTVIGATLGDKVGAIGLKLPPGARIKGIRSHLCFVIIQPTVFLMLGLMAATWDSAINGFAILATTLALAFATFLCLGGSVAILRALHLVSPVDPSTAEACNRIAAEDGIRIRHVLAMDLGLANAFAFSWTKDIAFTRPALDALDTDELQSIFRHELGHLKEGLLIRITRVASVWMFIIMGLTPLVMRQVGGLASLLILVIPLLCMNLFARAYKRWEVSADKHANAGSVHHPVYARALEKLHETSLIPANLGKNHLYPPLHDRMAMAGVTPDFKNPKAPSKWVGLISGVAGIAVFLLIFEATC